MIDKILEKYGLTYNDLNSAERETISSWITALGENQLNLEKVKLYLASMRESVERELTETSHNSKQDLFLKARLKNYLLLEALLTTPEKAKEMLEQALSRLGRG